MDDLIYKLTEARITGDDIMFYCHLGCECYECSGKCMDLLLPSEISISNLSQVNVPHFRILRFSGMEILKLDQEQFLKIRNGRWW